MDLLTLTALKGDQAGIKVPVFKDFLIGRSPDCDLRPASRYVSNRHCQICYRSGNVLLRDLQSTNGTYVNEQRVVDSVDLIDGDVIRIGPLEFRCLFSPPSYREPQRRA